MQITCQKCGKTMDEGQFYTYRDGRKMELCKKCLTMHLDPFNPETYTWIIQKADVPYIPEEWNAIRDKDYETKGKKMTGMAVFGKYLSKMKLVQYKGKGWADSEAILAERAGKAAAISEEKAEADRAFNEEMRRKFEAGEISEAEYKTMTSPEIQHVLDTEQGFSPKLDTTGAPPGALINGPSPMMPGDYMLEEDLVDTGADLTDEDKMYLAMKWGRLYKPHEWVELEKTYNEMIDSFDIQDADTINTLILICKTDLKMNQAIDMGDLDGFQKLSRVSDSLRKSAKFTAAQNKEQKDDFVDSIGELVAMCERDGFIPRYVTDVPQDKVDFTLRDMQEYLHTLVTKDLGFGQQIEDALKKIQIQKEMDEAADAAADEVEELEDEDYEAFYEEIERQRALDSEEEYDNGEEESEE